MTDLRVMWSVQLEYFLKDLFSPPRTTELLHTPTVHCATAFYIVQAVSVCFNFLLKRGRFINKDISIVINNETILLTYPKLEVGNE